MIVSFVRYDYIWGLRYKKSSFLLGIQTEIFIVEIIIYLEFTLNIPEKKMK